MFNNLYDIGTKNTGKRYWTSLWEESCIHSCTRSQDMGGTIIISFLSFVAPVGLYLQIRRLSEVG